jgi:hypothetical protein
LSRCRASPSATSLTSASWSCNPAPHANHYG